MSKIKSTAAAVGLLALGALAWDKVIPAAPAQEKKEAVPVVQKWEYRILAFDEFTEAKFNQVGGEGWEVVGTNGHMNRAIFKRPKK